MIGLRRVGALVVTTGVLSLAWASPAAAHAGGPVSWWRFPLLALATWPDGLARGAGAGAVPSPVSRRCRRSRAGPRSWRSGGARPSSTVLFMIGCTWTGLFLLFVR